MNHQRKKACLQNKPVKYGIMFSPGKVFKCPVRTPGELFTSLVRTPGELFTSLVRIPGELFTSLVYRELYGSITLIG